jgi:hypothetical protein
VVFPERSGNGGGGGQKKERRWEEREREGGGGESCVRHNRHVALAMDSSSVPSFRATAQTRATVMTRTSAGD